SKAFAASKKLTEVALATSTSLKTTPKPRDRAACALPGTKKLTSTTLEPIAVNSRCALNGAKNDGYDGSMLPNSIGVEVGFAALALTWNPVPGVEKTTPRGEFALKKFAGRL